MPSTEKLHLPLVPDKNTTANSDEISDSDHGPVASLPPDSQPNGGWMAWLQVAGCFALYLNTLGLVNSFGAFQTYYEQVLLPSSSPSAISWIGSIQAFCLMAGGVVIGPLFDAGYFHTLLVIGTSLVTLGFMMTSLCTAYWQVFLAQGICLGLGESAVMVPAIAIVPMWFSTRKPIAMAVATIGSGMGSTVYPLLFEALQTRIGFGWTVRTLGFISLALGIFAIAVTRPRYKTRPKRAGNKEKRSLREIVRHAYLGDKTYLVCIVSIFFNNVGFFEPLFYLQSYALAHGMANMSLAGYLLSILNASSIPGRLLPALLSHLLGVVNTMTFIYFMSAASCFYWISASNEAGNVAFAVLYGFFSGGVVAFQPVVLASITEDLSYLGTRLGFLAILKGIGSLIGPPIAGAILESKGGYLGVQLFTGFAILLSVVFSVVLRVMLPEKNGFRG